MVKTKEVFAVSFESKAPLSNKSQIISLLKTIPISVARDKREKRIKDDFFIRYKALFLFLFFIALAIIGNKATEVAIAKSAKGS